MDMKKILENMDLAAKGEKPSAGAKDVNDMKTILESIQQVEECGMDEGCGSDMSMPTAPEDKVSMNVNLSARGDAVEDLIKLMGGAMSPQEAPVHMPAPTALPAPDTHDDEMGDMKKLMKISTDGPEMPAMEDEDDVEEEWDNSPEEEYSNVKTMTKDLSGGLNREKKAYKATQDGDNPMALENSIKEELWKALSEKLTTEGRGRGKKAKEDIETTEGRGRGRGKKK